MTGSQRGARILFTGGGSAGHVTPNLGLIERCREAGWEIAYAGSADGIEREIIAQTGVRYHAVASGKLRRYFSWRNFVDPLRLLLGIFQSILLCRRIRPQLLFSKGGFVAVPVVIGAWVNRVPVITHESDVTPGLANRLCMPFARRICVTFPQTAALLPPQKVVVSGTPVRRGVLRGDRERGRRFLGLDPGRKTLLFFGGSLGAAVINRCVIQALDQLLAEHQVVHICGAGNRVAELDGRPHYHQREYLHDEFGDVLAAADLVVSRAGANSLYELLLLRKPHILVPLGRQASRGDQIENARAFSEQGMSEVIYEEQLTPAVLLAAIGQALARSSALVARMESFATPDAVEVIFALLDATAARSP